METLIKLFGLRPVVIACVITFAVNSLFYLWRPDAVLGWPGMVFVFLVVLTVQFLLSGGKKKKAS